MSNVAPCQTATDRHAVAYSFDSLASNSMKSSNPHSGCRPVELSKPQIDQPAFDSSNTLAYGCTPTRLNEITNTITASYGQGGVDLETKPLALLVSRVLAVADDVTPKTSEGVAFTLSASDHKCPQAVAYELSAVYPINTQIATRHNKLGERTGLGIRGENEPAFTLQAAHSHAVATVDVKAFTQNTRNELRWIGGDGQIAGALCADEGMKQRTYLAFNSRQDPVSGDVFGALDTCHPQAQAIVVNESCSAIAIQGSMIGREPKNGPQGKGYDDTGVSFTQTAVDKHAVAVSYECTHAQPPHDEDDSPTLVSNHVGGEPVFQTAVRRLTPVECERLQGFPDGYTNTPWRDRYLCVPCGEEFTDKAATGIAGAVTPAACPKCGEQEKTNYNAPDGHRYKALGNSWAVPVVRWIGARINKEANQINKKREN